MGSENIAGSVFSCLWLSVLCYLESTKNVWRLMSVWVCSAAEFHGITLASAVAGDCSLTSCKMHTAGSQLFGNAKWCI